MAKMNEEKHAKIAAIFRKAFDDASKVAGGDAARAVATEELALEVSTKRETVALDELARVRHDLAAMTYSRDQIRAEFHALRAQRDMDASKFNQIRECLRLIVDTEPP